MNDEHRPTVDSLPQPVPTGTDTYYRERGVDFARRHPNRQQPSYYLDDGDKCLHQFRAVRPELSQQWLGSTLRLLQEAIEERHQHDPTQFEHLELDDQGFFETPDMTDVVSREGIAEILVLLAKLDRHDIAHIVTQTSDGDTEHGSSGILGWITRHSRRQT